MPRRSFFPGMLAGLVLGALLMFANLSLFHANQPPLPAAVVPKIVPVNLQTGDLVVPPEKRIPKSWQQFEFNGRPVYVIPLGQEVAINRR